MQICPVRCVCGGVRNRGKKERSTHRQRPDETEGMAEPEAGESKRKKQKERQERDTQRDKRDREGERERDKKKEREREAEGMKEETRDGDN